ncbi:MAG: SPFH domain-containing protein [Clostridia bacterium]|nr:SPFH domain-containing protein [Clostridia bacterium]
MALFRTNIVWNDDSKDTIVYKYPFKNYGREINDKSTLTVKDSQVAIFVYKGQIADVFAPGLYNLKTGILPILTRLAAWKYAFETPITLDVYFVNTKQFTNIKWGTLNPIMMRDPEFGVIRVRGFGAFAFKVDDPAVFLRELFGTNSSFKTEDITGFLKTMLVSALSDALGESKISAIDLAGNTLEFNEIVKQKIQEKFKEIGLLLTNLFIENMSVPPEVEKALDERAKYGILGDSTDTMMKVSAAEAMKSAAKNPGGSGAFMGAGVGIGAGLGVGNYMAGAFVQQNANQQQANKNLGGGNESGTVCKECGAKLPKGAKFCSECGAKVNEKKFCPNCGAAVTADAKFCGECGTKL